MPSSSPHPLATSVVAARSCTLHWSGSGSPSQGSGPSTSAPRPAGSRTACWPHGAAHVVALDVGHGQLHPRLRNDDRVTVLERTNAKAATTELIGGPADVLVADLSFISLVRVIPVLIALCHPGSPMVLLVKPQFEAGRVEVARGRGVITDVEIHERVRTEIDAALVDAGCTVVGWMDSPLVGGKGNRELFVHAGTPGGGR